jgi:hypothetical protein
MWRPISHLRRKKINILRRRKCYYGIGRLKAGSQVRFKFTHRLYTTIGSHVTETKVLKQRVRDHIDPSRDLGHSDKHGKQKPVEQSGEQEAKQEEQKEPDDGVEVKRNPDGTICEDCR